jgi:hypothetical protein
VLLWVLSFNIVLHTQAGGGAKEEEGQGGELFACAEHT